MTTCRRTRPMAGSSSASGRTTSSMCRSASPATTSCRVTGMHRFAA
jgi:hypothetical protein